MKWFNSSMRLPNEISENLAWSFSDSLEDPSARFELIEIPDLLIWLTRLYRSSGGSFFVTLYTLTANFLASFQTSNVSKEYTLHFNMVKCLNGEVKNINPILGGFNQKVNPLKKRLISL